MGFEIAEIDRTKVVKALTVLLADTFTLYLKTHNYHWNLETWHFASWHPFLEELYTENWNAIDTLAEKIRALGHYAPATMQEYLKLTSLKEVSKHLKAEDMLKDLLADHLTVVKTARKVIEIADKVKDYSTADIVTQRLNVHDKQAWMLRSILAKGS